jgi:hypothetical protein
MSSLAAAHGDAAAAASPRLSREALRRTLLWLMGFSGAFVFLEPSPYEVVGLLTIVIFALTGLTLRPALAPLLLLLLALDIGYAVALLQVEGHQPKTITWVAVSAFLGATAVFYAAILSRNTKARLDWVLSGTVAGGVIASLVGIGAYFHVFGGSSETFLLYGRARGTFNDPNVLGAFLVLPALLTFQRILTQQTTSLLRSVLVLMALAGGLFFSFSRAAWGQFALCSMFVMALSFISARSTQERARIVTVALAGIVAIAVMVAVLLSIGKVDQLFQERATLDQSYDLGHYGRFGRYILGAQLGLDRPFGIGPLQFSHYFPEDPHNTFLNTFMSGGWLGGLAYLTLTLVTLTTALRFLLVATPWRGTYQVVYAACMGVIGESAIIDIDHWRHFFLIIGLLWGLMAATQAWLREKPQL